METSTEGVVSGSTATDFPSVRVDERLQPVVDIEYVVDSSVTVDVCRPSEPDQICVSKCVVTE
jgi:hypothetical protein